MFGGGMKVDSSLLFERNKIIWSFGKSSMAITELDETDLSAHKDWMKKVYAESMRIYEISELDLCCRRFKKAFETGPTLTMIKLN
jgi:hypothetical protein